MSLILHSPKSYISAGTKVEVAAKFLGIELEFNRIPKSEWKSAEHLKRHPLGKVPVLETPEGCIYESLSIIRYLARKAGKMYGSTPGETAQIDQWLEFNNTQIQPYISATLYVLFGYLPSTQEKYSEAKKGFIEVLKIIDNQLASH
jgi:elongation factor 1-gamma